MGNQPASRAIASANQASAAALLCVSAHARMDDLIAEGNTNGYWIGIDVLASLFLGGQKPPPPAPTKVKVFVAGLPRTGTGSLTLALKELGYRPLWGEDLFDFADELESLYAGKLSKAELLDVIAALATLPWSAPPPRAPDDNGWTRRFSPSSCPTSLVASLARGRAAASRRFVMTTLCGATHALSLLCSSVSPSALLSAPPRPRGREFPAKSRSNRSLRSLTTHRRL